MTWVTAGFPVLDCMPSLGGLSPLPAYSLGETFVWFRFPVICHGGGLLAGARQASALFDAAVCRCWHGGHVCILDCRDIDCWPAWWASCPGPMAIWCRAIILPRHVCRHLWWWLRWRPPAKDGQQAGLRLIALISIVASVMTGERINFLIRACSGMLAAVGLETPKLSCCADFAPLKAIAVVFSAFSDPGTLYSGSLTILSSNFRPMATAHIFVRWHPGGWPFEESPVWRWSRQSAYPL